MYLLPAIDILGGRAVRLKKGDYDQVTVYNEDPVAQAEAFSRAGASWIHVVDLDGAKQGTPVNLDVIKRIVAATSLHIEVGGGIRTRETIEALLDAGVSRVVLGTALVRDPAFAEEALRSFGCDALAAGIDARGGEVAVSGWLEGSGLAARDFAQSMAALGYRHLIYTDIARDGVLTGIDPAAYQAMAQAFGRPVIASGGVASVDDIRALAAVAPSIEGVIAGRAIYEGRLSVEEGIAACEEAGSEAGKEA